ncbi:MULTISPECIES: tail fiber domain-containing protein [Variovorax]|uniref:tail fiber domain-containing protein n=1 Tax=Variovorax TaxID=34072 RepID=UPI002854FF6F|nr:tail fiber domain-containing protein [Variovorax sp. 3319]MDR6886153.1 hypothetical protein [Variovorax sp. 3319]
MTDRRPLVVVSGTPREIATGDTVPVANGGTGAITAAAARTNLGAVNIAGDTMTGNLSVAHAGSTELRIDSSNDNAVLIFDKGASGKTNAINAMSNNAIRWQMQFGDSTSESGSNAGSNFSIGRFSDAGAALANAFSIRRSDGQVDIAASVIAQSYGIFAGTQILGGAQAVASSNYGTSGSTNFNNFLTATVNGSVGVLSYQHTPGTSAAWQFQVNNSTANFTFLNNGRAQAAVAWDVVSDERLKTKFEPITDALDRIDHVDVETYERVDEPSPMHGPSQRTRYVGVRAQRMRVALREGVTVAGTEAMPGRLVVASDAAGLLALAAVKELKALVMALQAELHALRNPTPSASLSGKTK